MPPFSSIVRRNETVMKIVAIRPVPALIGTCVVLGWMAAFGLFWESSAVSAVRPEDSENLDRTVLPIPEPKHAPITTLDARNAKAPLRFEVKAPAKAPNVLIILIDDMGFGQSSAFGGPVHMPTVERLAKGGLRYNQFHTTRAMFADPRGPAFRPQPSRLHTGVDYRNRHRLLGPDRAASQ